MLEAELDKGSEVETGVVEDVGAVEEEAEFAGELLAITELVLAVDCEVTGLLEGVGDVPVEGVDVTAYVEDVAIF